MTAALQTQPRCPLPRARSNDARLPEPPSTRESSSNSGEADLEGSCTAFRASNRLFRPYLHRSDPRLFRHAQARAKGSAERMERSGHERGTPHLAGRYFVRSALGGELEARSGCAAARGLDWPGPKLERATILRDTNAAAALGICARLPTSSRRSRSTVTRAWRPQPRSPGTSDHHSRGPSTWAWTSRRLLALELRRRAGRVEARPPAPGCRCSSACVPPTRPRPRTQ
jgi:hypothetical protein